LSSGFSAEISVFVKTGDSVQLDIQTQELPEFDLLSWRNDKSVIIVRYISGTKEVKPHNSYKDRVDFSDKTFSLTLKNMQKTDTGLYTARTSGNSENNIAAYRVSVIDEVATPVLTVNSNWSSPDSCSFTCKGSNIIISSIYKSSSCSPEEVTSSDNYTLNLNCSDDYIMCIHSNPVSSKTARKKVNELCTVDQETPQAIKHSPYPTWFILLICLLIICLLASVIGWCLYKRKKAIKKKSHISGTGGGPPTQDFTPAEELALDLNKGKPVIEGIQGGTATDSGPARETGLFIQLAGNTLTLLEPPDYDSPREATSTAVECTSADDETVSLDSRRLEDPDIGQPDKQPGNINSQTVRNLYTTHLKRQIELTEVKIDVSKRKLQDMDLEMQIKRKTLRKLELEIQKLERELQADK
ncbi:hypothetical protein PO909_031494, partial [Leuciscus waleckii]